ncbi:lactase-phlorizin hydrolase-like [Rhopalosiphum maidis]|uniref:lactase-phlorizin hydrolase-like n=1 Tax=Rhopalosiphum maidis TaxID=43146 RepID=UPI000F00F312|nr:lactase-phlorizin hydrolase-like [Rhopalosiphum maidis]
MASDKKVKFPEKFMIGTGSSAYQIEGAWDADNKAPSIWDDYFHIKKYTEPPTVSFSAPKKNINDFHKGTELPTLYSETTTTYINGDIACDSYNKLDEDIDNLVELGVNTYRFSISWPRVLPDADDRNPNYIGIKYYETLIKKLIAKKITPLVTIYHWDMPSILQDLGGWSNPNIVEYFVNYANFLFRTFGKYVKYWTTINEPRLVVNAYGNELLAPSIGEMFNGIADYMAARNVLLAHAAVYRLYKKDHFAEQQGYISSLCFDTMAFFPKDPKSEEDKHTVSKAYDFMLGLFAQPLIDGNFPKSVIDGVAKTNKIENIALKRIVEFSEEEKNDIKGSYDFIAFNYYDSAKVTPMVDEQYVKQKYLQKRDFGVAFDIANITMEDTFKGFTEVVTWFKKKFGETTELFIAENGFAEKYGTDETDKKIKYHTGIWTELEKALNDGVAIKGYCVWSFMDSLEWTSGYFKKSYGIYRVDFNDPKRPRSKKSSFAFFKHLFETKSLLFTKVKTLQPKKMASDKKFKIADDFLIGTGSSAFQIEGGWNQDKKSPSIWDDYFHTKNLKVTNPTIAKSAPRKKYTNFHRGTDFEPLDETNNMEIINGDIACDSYNKLDEDIKNLVELGVNTYRFSISWPRVLPTADDRNENEPGINYYKLLIKNLIKNKITPVVTMYHWDLPNILQGLGGWSNPHIVEYFVNYADFLFRTFGKDVKYWTTINEPRFVANAYGDETMAPSVGVVFNGFAEYMVIRNLLLAHAAVYRMYKKKYYETQKGKISLCFDTAAYFPENPKLQADIDAVPKAFDFMLGIFTEPLKNGNFPDSVLKSIADTNKREKITIKRIIEFSETEKKDIIDSYDFIAFNYYDSFKVQGITDDDYKEQDFLLNKDLRVKVIPNGTNLADTFQGFTNVVDWLKKNLNKPELFIAENGIYDAPNKENNELKIEYHRGIWTEIEKAVEKGAAIKGYCVWSFMDSLEWSKGYFDKWFGIYKVDFNDPDRPRTKKQSFDFFQHLFKFKALPPPIKSNK